MNSPQYKVAILSTSFLLCHQKLTRLMKYATLKSHVFVEMLVEFSCFFLLLLVFFFKSVKLQSIVSNARRISRSRMSTLDCHNVYFNPVFAELLVTKNAMIHCEQMCTVLLVIPIILFCFFFCKFYLFFYWL